MVSTRSRAALTTTAANCEVTPARVLRSRTVLGTKTLCQKNTAALVNANSLTAKRKRTAGDTDNVGGDRPQTEAIDVDDDARLRASGAKRPRNVLTDTFKQVKASTPCRGKKSTTVLKTPNGVSATTPTTKSKSNNSPTKPKTPRTPASILQEAKSLFRRCSTPTRIVGRVSERQCVLSFWEKHVLGGKPGALYISGCPGTGKTALVEEVCEDMKEETKSAPHPVQIIKLNCMSLRNPKMIFAALLEACEAGTSSSDLRANQTVELLQQYFVPASKTKRAQKLYVVILDEVDNLVTRDQEILYQLFEWPTLPGSRMVLIGIANALDLIERILPRLRAKNCEPQLLNFNPYETAEITAIIKERLKTLKDTEDEADTENRSSLGSGNVAGSTNATKTTTTDAIPIMHPSAVEFCARKVVATGDLRKALDVCRKAIEVMEADIKSSPHAGSSSSVNKASPFAPNTARPSSAIDLDRPVDSLDVVPKVTVQHIMKVTAAVFGSPIVIQLRQLNFHQKLVLAALVLLAKTNKLDAINIGKVHETYNDICYENDRFKPVSRTEFHDMLGMLESQGHVSLGKAKDERKRKVTLNARAEDVKSATSDLPLVMRVLEKGLTRTT
ncbi:AAA ATPase [Quaeritorhiza haematococci]|nr:AAA ATPase [Quaeritorhiza haematococci]